MSWRRFVACLCAKHLPTQVQQDFVLPAKFVLPGVNFVFSVVNFVSPRQKFVLPGVNFVLPRQNFVLPGVNFVFPGVNFVLPRVNFLGVNFIFPGENFVLASVCRLVCKTPSRPSPGGSSRPESRPRMHHRRSTCYETRRLQELAQKCELLLHI